MTTISEGVETISQVEFLRKADCDLVQGYVYSKPLAKDDFEITFLKNENIQVKKYINIHRLYQTTQFHSLCFHIYTTSLRICSNQHRDNTYVYRSRTSFHFLF